jgi:hypothetical protein
MRASAPGHRGIEEVLDACAAGVLEVGERVVDPAVDDADHHALADAFPLGLELGLHPVGAGFGADLVERSCHTG